MSDPGSAEQLQVVRHELPEPPDRPLRILFIHSTRHDANEYKVHRLLAESIDPAYVDAMFVWQTNELDRTTDVTPDLSRPGRVHHMDFGRTFDQPEPVPRWRRGAMTVGRYPLAVLRIARMIRSFRPDVLYTTQQRHEVFLAHQLASVFRLPHVIHVCYEVGPWLGERTLRTIVDNDHIIGSCDFVRRSAIEQGARTEATCYVHHIADVEEFLTDEDPGALRRELGVSPDTPIVTAAARLDDGKGFPLLVEAFATVLASRPDARLVIVGEASQGTSFDRVIRQRVEQLGIGDSVEFLGFRDDLPSIFAGSDIFALPLLADAVSLVFLGAMLKELPCVSIRSGSVPEVVLHGTTGLVSEPGDPAALAANLVRLIDDRSLRKALGRNGRTYATEHFSAENISAWWWNELDRWFGERVRTSTPVRAASGARRSTAEPPSRT